MMQSFDCPENQISTMDTSNLLIKNYGVYGSEYESLSQDFVHCERIEDGSKKNNYRFDPHIHSHLFQVFFFTEGTATFITEKGEHHIEAPCIITVPENHQHASRTNELTRGLSLTLSVELVQNVISQIPNGKFEFEEIRIIQNDNTHELKAKIFQYAEELYQEYLQDGPNVLMGIIGFLNLIFVNIHRIILQTKAVSIKSDRLSNRYFSDFIESIKSSESSQKPITAYAKELKITPTHLNRICKSVVGKTASQIVQEYAIMRSKRYLDYTSYSVSEIAYLMKFRDPGYFCRFFKKKTGYSPKKYRSRNKALSN